MPTRKKKGAPVRDGLKELEDINAVFRALAHATRRHILVVLRARGGRMTAGDIAQRFSCAWPTTSRHLAVLLAAGLVVRDKNGKERFYTLNRARLRDVAGGWLDWIDQKGTTG